MYGARLSLLQHGEAKSKPALKSPGTTSKCSKLKYGEVLSFFAFNFTLPRYNTVAATYLTLTLNHIVTLTATNIYKLGTSSTSTSGNLYVMSTENSLAIESFP